MKKLLALLAVVALGSTVTAGTLTVRGTVDTGNGVALQGATVTVSFGGMGGAGVNKTLTTNAGGVYSFDTLIAGNYGFAMVTISATKAGFDTVTSQPQFVMGLNNNVRDTLTYDITLQRAGTVGPGAADSLYVSGTVTDATTGDSIPGASVQITLGNAGVPSVVTTNNKGHYSFVTINSAAANRLTIVVTAVGYQSATQRPRITNPANGTADDVVQDFELTATAAATYDTIWVKGAVVDSANTSTGIVGASVIVSRANFGIGGTMSTSYDTVASGVSGVVMGMIVLPSSTFGQVAVSWSVEKSGYASAGPNRDQIVNDTLDIGRVALTAYSSTDTINYVIYGGVTDANTTLGVRNAQVIVVMKRGSTTLFTDTVTSNNFTGTYQTGIRLPYVAGDVSVTINVTATRYQSGAKTVTVASSTDRIGVSLALTPTSSGVVSMRPAGIVGGARTSVRAYSLSGRLMGTADRSTMRSLQAARQPMLLRAQDVTTKTVK
jgi:hypothetical protein